MSVNALESDILPRTDLKEQYQSTLKEIINSLHIVPVSFIYFPVCGLGKHEEPSSVRNTLFEEMRLFQATGAET